ncbi:hypothetical protein PHLCEN_2v7245 [Hermanssonia centrifuga]|uniref:Angiogenic factor with G patch and FHA domains 1 n=1 Tax=Hermanssonia centrifuga TaxID=98765 RepID=A0A2R6NXA3_9APHY|nr:hypothetical protein PHLCEN_2v7245 [Hermanssonia centrifuga]
MEDGELHEDISGGSYHPSLEWTPDVPELHGLPTDSSPSSSKLSSDSPSLHLCVRQSSILHKTHALAVIDGYTEVQFGRDVAPVGSDTPRVRLKEMEVSKLHATVYWDQERSEWAVVDMGSKHGTYLQSPHTWDMSMAGPVASENASSSTARGHRLSPPRISSVPRKLRHLDELSIGSTKFVVHIHSDSIPCAECSPKGGDEIPLFSQQKVAGGKRKRESSELPVVVPSPEQRDPKKALSMLKRSLLSRPTVANTSSAVNSGIYVDRSARRRALHPDAPGIPSIIGAGMSSGPSTAPSSRPPSPPPVSAPSAPLPSTNIGHRLLMKQGWLPGTSLGSTEAEPVEGSIALLEPIEVLPRGNRTGLGVPDRSAAPVSTPNGSWKDEAKFRRWANVKSDS